VEAPEAEGQPQAVSSPASSRRIFGRAATRYCAQTAYTMNVLPGASPMTRTPDARAHRKRPGHVSGKAGEARAGEAPNGHDLAAVTARDADRVAARGHGVRVADDVRVWGQLPADEVAAPQVCDVGPGERVVVHVAPGDAPDVPAGQRIAADVPPVSDPSRTSRPVIDMAAYELPASATNSAR
jgi:hypothetical protein